MFHCMGQLPFEKIKREIIIKKEATSSEKFGCKPEERSIEQLIKYGLININKPAGPTSHQISECVKNILNIDKAGHFGTLDPNVTGVLSIGLGKATILANFLLSAGKEYVCLMYLHKDVETKKIIETAKKFTGIITQLPPVRSAIKRQEREREIYYFELLEIDGREVLFKVGCEAGTYIRKLCSDFGKALKTDANMSQLIRTKAGPFLYEDMVTLHDLQDAYVYWKEGDEKLLRKIILPIEAGVKHLPKIYVLDSAIDALCHGAYLYAIGVSKFESNIDRGDLVAVMSLKGELICVGYAEMNSKELGKRERGTAIRTTRVFMERGTYANKNQ